MLAPDPERQVQFLVNVRRLLSDGSFVATYKFALLLSLAELAVEGVDETTESVSVSTRDLAEKFIGFYWRQVLPWVHGPSRSAGRLHQATGSAAAILNLVAAAHERYSGSLFRCRADKPQWKGLVGDVARIIGIMPLWKLQTIGRQKLDFLYPNTGTGNVIRLHGEAVYCLNRFRELIEDMTQAAWGAVRAAPAAEPNAHRGGAGPAGVPVRVRQDGARPGAEPAPRARRQPLLLLRFRHSGGAGGGPLRAVGALPARPGTQLRAGRRTLQRGEGRSPGGVRPPEPVGRAQCAARPEGGVREPNGPARRQGDTPGGVMGLRAGRAGEGHGLGAGEATG